MKLTMVTLYPSMYEMEGTQPEYRLVYEVIPDRRVINAITGVDYFGIEHYMMPPSHPIAPIERDDADSLGDTLTFEESERGKKLLNSDDPSKGLIKNIVAWEMLLGIDPRLYVLKKSKDDDERIELLYKLKEEVDEELEPEALSVDAYIKRKWGDSLRKLESSFMIQIEKVTHLEDDLGVFIQLHYYEDVPIKQIVELVDVPEGTVKIPAIPGSYTLG